MTPLRERYALDLRLRNKSPRTIETYVLRVAQFAKHFHRSPERLGPEHLRAYQEHLIARGVSWSTFNQAVCALRFLYQVTLGRPEEIRYLPFAKRPRTTPLVLSPKEVTRLLAAALPASGPSSASAGFGGRSSVCCRSAANDSTSGSASGHTRLPVFVHALMRLTICGENPICRGAIEVKGPTRIFGR